MKPDYCTSWWDRLWNWDWSDCCRLHDEAYAAGIDRALADEALAKCVALSMGGDVPYLLSLLQSAIMWVGVRIFGAAYWVAATVS